MVTNYDYCVSASGPNPSTGSPTSIPTSTKYSSSTSSSGNGITTPTPVETPIASNCNRFYLVVSGDSCASIASSHGIAQSDFLVWNPSINAACTNLWVGYYVCVNVIRGSTSTSSKLMRTSTRNGVTTPTPTQVGMATNCNTFRLVVSGDQCGTITTNAGITLASFYTWNPGVGLSCQSLWLGYYVCIGILP